MRKCLRDGRLFCKYFAVLLTIFVFVCAFVDLRFFCLRCLRPFRNLFALLPASKSICLSSGGLDSSSVCVIVCYPTCKNTAFARIVCAPADNFSVPFARRVCSQRQFPSEGVAAHFFRCKGGRERKAQGARPLPRPHRRTKQIVVTLGAEGFMHIF